jgi:hypothetical protein
VKLKLTLKFGPLRAERIIDGDACTIERLITQTGPDGFEESPLKLDIPDCMWRDGNQLKISYQPVREAQWLGRTR